MSESPTLQHLPMSMGYFRLILRSFGDAPERRAAILAGTGVTDEVLGDPSAEISLFQQVRQVENLADLVGEDWVFRAPGLWNPTVHGPLGVASIAAPDLAAMMDVVTRFAFVRAPFHGTSLRRGPRWSQIEFDLTVPLDERIWRPLIEITFVSMRAGIATILAAPPTEARYFFACAKPPHAAEVRAILGDDVTYDAPRNAIRFPSAWLALQSPFADAALYDVAVAELQAAVRHITEPVALRSRIERLLSALPAGHLAADEAARFIGVSRRTLVRRLAEAGVSYRQLVDAELRNRAQRLLQDGRLSRARIAEKLGYRDPTSLSRARRRWSRGSCASN
ncbi:MAG TPA: AraC family transcriptional regulator ligand-binding domain-containing protein [Parvibaculum sp.]